MKTHYEPILLALEPMTLFTATSIIRFAEQHGIPPFDQELAGDQRQTARMRLRVALVRIQNKYCFPDKGDGEIEHEGVRFPAWFGRRWLDTTEDQQMTPVRLAGRFYEELIAFDQGKTEEEHLEPGLRKMLAVFAESYPEQEQRFRTILEKLSQCGQPQTDAESFVMERLISIAHFWGERAVAKEMMTDIEAQLQELALQANLGDETIDLLIGLSPPSLEYWRNAWFWKALRDFSSMVSPEQVLSDILAESDPKTLTLWLDWDETHLSYLDQVMKNTSYSSGLDLLQDAYLYHVKTMYAETLTLLQS